MLLGENHQQFLYQPKHSTPISRNYHSRQPFEDDPI